MLWAALRELEFSLIGNIFFASDSTSQSHNEGKVCTQSLKGAAEMLQKSGPASSTQLAITKYDS